MKGKIYNNAGSKVTSVINATVNVIAEIIPNWDVGIKLETVFTIKPETNTIVEVSIANPVVSIVLDIAISIFEFFFFSCQNLNKKCSESSTAIPKQIENVIAIGGRIGIPWTQDNQLQILWELSLEAYLPILSGQIKIINP